MHSTPCWLPQTMTWLYNQLRFLPPSVTNHIVCETNENIAQFNLPNIHCFSDKNPWFYQWEKMLCALGLQNHYSFQNSIVRKHSPHILHSHFAYRGWADMEIAKSSGTKHLVSVYGYDVTGLLKAGSRWLDRYLELFERADRILCEGPHMAKHLQNIGCPEEKIKILRLGVCINEIEFIPRTWENGAPFRILIAATFKEKKGIPYALEALGRVLGEVPLEITLIGDATSEPRSQLEKEKIIHTLKSQHLLAKIRLMGFQTHSILMKEAYKHHIFLSPSVTAGDGDTEGGAPVSIIEMAATGMPIVSTKHCDIPRVINDETTGLLATERDIGGLTERLRWLTSHPENWISMVKAGRSHVEKEFNASTQGELLAKFYREILE